MIETMNVLEDLFSKHPPREIFDLFEDFLSTLRAGSWANRETFEDFLLRAKYYRPSTEDLPFRARMVKNGPETPHAVILDPVRPKRELKYLDCAYTLRAARTTRGKSEYYMLAAADSGDFPDLFRLKDPASPAAWIGGLGELSEFASNYIAQECPKERDLNGLAYYFVSIGMLEVAARTALGFYESIFDALPF